MADYGPLDPAKIDAALAVLSDPSKWTRGYYARDARREFVGPSHPTAVMWDLEGALMRAGSKVGSNEWRAVRQVIRRYWGDYQPYEFNDAPFLKFSDVIAVLTEAKRPHGTTSRQMRSAPNGALFVWCNEYLDYPRGLAQHLHRADLTIVRPSILQGTFPKLRARRFTALIVDHAFQAADGETIANIESLRAIYARVFPRDGHNVGTTQPGSEMNQDPACAEPSPHARNPP